MSTPAWTIVVIDDSSRFPLHVWRYLSQSLGLGIGYVRKYGEVVWQGEQPKQWITAVGAKIADLSTAALRSDDGSLQLLWARADRSALAGVKRAIDLAGDSQILVLADIQGEYGYDVDAVLAAVGKRAEARRVSAYYSDPQEDGGSQVLTKTRESLHEIASFLRKAMGASSCTTSETATHHILVTGAGFEAAGDQGGFGLPPTAAVLHQIDEARLPRKSLSDVKSVLHRARKRGMKPNETFPLPREAKGRYLKQIKAAAGITGEQSLDTYWDLLLEHQLSETLRQADRKSPTFQRDQWKVEALRKERDLREAFRYAMLRYDWGYLRQALTAAQLPWRAWLTTNYTRFADRAVALQGGPSWRIIASAAEGRMLVRDTSSPVHPPAHERYLFKLHGDIAHMQTMAIAGNDKDIFSPLSVPIDDLYQIYEVAVAQITALATENISQAASGASSDSGVVAWHIVGHGLRDLRLMDLLHRCARSIEAAGRPLVFFVADLKATDVAHNLRQALAAGSRVAASVFEFSETAVRYMGRFAPWGNSGPPRFPPFDRLQDCEAWARTEGAGGGAPPAP